MHENKRVLAYRLPGEPEHAEHVGFDVHEDESLDNPNA